MSVVHRVVVVSVNGMMPIQLPQCNHNTSEETQKLATYAAKIFQLLGEFASDPMTRDSALGPHWGHNLKLPAYFSQT